MAGPRRRRFDHAHPVGSPPGAAPPGAAPPGAAPRPVSARPPRWPRNSGAAVVLALIVVTAALVAFRPTGAGSATAGGPGHTGAAPAGATSSHAPALPSLGAHGDGVVDETPHVPAPTPDPPTVPLDPGPTPAGELTGYRWPLENARITNGFGAGRPGSFVMAGLTFHDGIDIASFCGHAIVAAHHGVVLTSGRHSEAHLGWLGDLGAFRARLDAEQGWSAQSITIVTDDLNGYRSVYAHLARTAVKAGDEVKAGDVIAYEGASGHATGCHLHYALFNPLDTRTLELDPKIAAKTRLPAREVMRIDPLLVLPDPATASITWGWGSRDEVP